MPAFDISDSTLTDADLLAVKEAYIFQSKALKSTNVPSPLLFKILEGKLSLPLDLNSFKLSLSRSVAAKKIPGFGLHLGRHGGFGPNKEENKNDQVNPVRNSVVSHDDAPAVVAKVSDPDRVASVSKDSAKPEAKEVKTPVTEKPVVLTPRDLARFDEPKISIEGIKNFAKSLPGNPDPDLLTAAPIIPIVPSRPEKKWNQKRALEFLDAFIPACLLKEGLLLRAKAAEMSFSEEKTRALFRIALGWDPAKVNSPFFRWDEFFNAAQEM